MNISKAKFEFHRTNPSFWYQKSVSLYASAKLLWDAMSAPEDRDFLDSLDLNGEFSVSIGCEHPYLMLFGLSYELMLKAICIANETEIPQKNHDLKELSNIAGVKLNDKERTQLRLLSEFVTWEGRYPVPKKHEKMTQHWNSTRKALWQTESFFGMEVKSRTDIFEYESLKSLWLKFSNVYINLRT